MNAPVTSKANKVVVLRALQHLKVLKRIYAEYQEDVAAWYRSGDGRSPNWRTDITDDGEVYRWNAGGLGYRYPSCIHGRSLWVDWDCNCGPCEEGLTVYELALHRAWRDFREMERRSLLISPLWEDKTIPSGPLMALSKWAVEPITEEV